MQCAAPVRSMVRAGRIPWRLFVTVICSPWLAESNKSSGACSDPLGF